MCMCPAILHNLKPSGNYVSRLFYRQETLNFVTWCMYFVAFQNNHFNCPKQHEPIGPYNGNTVGSV
jgi:hypothetical protein